jgi:NADH-quinone oxidoreductase subunit M
MLLTLLVFLPLIGAVALQFFEEKQAFWLHQAATGIAALPLCLGFLVWWNFAPEFSGVQMGTNLVWFSLPLGKRTLVVHYALGVDGIRLLPTLLMSGMGLWVLRSAQQHSPESPRSFYFFVLSTQSALLGAVLAQDLLLLAFFWQWALFGLFFLLGSWGKNAEKAALRMFLFLTAGALLFQVALWTIGVQSGTLLLSKLASHKLSQDWLRWLLPLALLGILPSLLWFPLHSWWHEVNVHTPKYLRPLWLQGVFPLGAVLLMSVVVPVFAPVWSGAVSVLTFFAVLGVVVGACLTLVETRKGTPWTSVSLTMMSLVCLGILCTEVGAWQGALLLLCHHSLAIGALQELHHWRESHTTEPSANPQLPQEDADASFVQGCTRFAFFRWVLVLSLVGIPGFAGFASLWLLVSGGWQTSGWLALFLAVGGGLLTLSLLPRLWTTPADSVIDAQPLSPALVTLLMVVLLLQIWMGLSPGQLLAPTQRTLHKTLSPFRKHQKTGALKVQKIRSTRYVARGEN